jgi:hypothetical protein
MKANHHGDHMKRMWMLLSVVALFVVAICFATDNLEMGTWKLNEAKSKMTGTTKNTTVIYEAVGDSVKVTVDGVDAYGKPMHNEWTGKYDGKDYPVTGDPTLSWLPMVSPVPLPSKEPMRQDIRLIACWFTTNSNYS